MYGFGGSFWTTLAERSGDSAFRLRTELPKRRRAPLAAAVQIYSFLDFARRFATLVS